MSSYRALFASVAALMMGGCVGTDIITDPVMIVPPRLELTPSMTALQVGQQSVLSAAFFDELGEQNSEITLSWSSANPEIVRVGPGGTLEAVGEGQAAIMATVPAANGDSILATATALITVIADRTTQLALIRVNPEMVDLSVGDTLQFTASGLNASEQVLVTDGFTWTSTAPQVLSIDASGVAIALTAGSASVRATTGEIQSRAVGVSILGSELLGTFFSRGGYTAEGTARLAPDEEGLLVLSFLDDFSIDRGPRLEVFLSPVDRVAPGSINVGILKEISGAQSYDLPEDAELGDYGWVIVHCVPFNVSFGFAELK